MTYKLFYRLLIYEITIFVSTLIFTTFIDFDKFNDRQPVLNVIISVISILIAIIITYLFSKLFSEKAVKIERKKEIDLLSKKVTYLRRIAFLIRSMHDFWKFRNSVINVNIKSTIDSRYADLTYEVYRYDTPGHQQYTPEEREQIDINIGGTDGQAYLALKGLEDDDSSYVLFGEFNPRNYSLEDIARYKEYAGSFWYFLDRSDRTVYNFDRVNRYWLNNMDELYFKIMGRQINTDNYRKSIKDLFTHFDQDIFEKHYYLNNLNSNSFSAIYKNSFLNMLVFLIILILAVFIFVIDSTPKFDYISTFLVLSIFIANTIDLIIITYQSIKIELEVTEIYEL